MSEIYIANLAMSQIIVKNPVRYETEEVKKDYLNRLRSYVSAGRRYKRKYESAQMKAYEEILSREESVQCSHGIDFYRYYLLLDVMYILASDSVNVDPKRLNKISERHFRDFHMDAAEGRLAKVIIDAFVSQKRNMGVLIDNKELSNEQEYIKLICKNYRFREKKPVRLMVTATMSAGKSTFINAVTGKHICRSQNMACTSKIHCIMNKAYEDGFSYEYDHELILTADKEELLNDNEYNTTDKITVGTYFDGYLNRQRIIINDSPGVNFSENVEHREIANKMIRKKKYNLLVYVMNATQLATNDEDEHLEFVKHSIGRTPVLFVLNKVDMFNTDEEDAESIVRRQREYLKTKGFKNPLVCPLSSRAGYLAKQFFSGNLSKFEKRELYNYVDKFEQMGLPKYYKKYFSGIQVNDETQEEKQLLKTCGLAYVELIIKKLVTGGNVNGTNLRKVQSIPVGDKD